MLLFRAYSHYSLLSALPQIKTLLQNAKEKGYTAIALCDEDSSVGLVDFYDTAKSLDIKPLLGTTLSLQNQLQNSYNQENGQFNKIAIIAKNKIGYKQLLELITIARTQNDVPKYHLTFANLQQSIAKHGQNIIINLTDKSEFANLVAGNNLKEAKKLLQLFVDTFGRDNIVVELINQTYKQSDADNQTINQNLAKICVDTKVLFLPSAAPRYINKEQDESFKAVLAIKKQTKVDEISLERDFDMPTLEELDKKYQYLNTKFDYQKIVDLVDFTLRTDYADKASEAFFPPVDLQKGQNYNDLLKWESYIGLLSRFHPDQKPKSYFRELFPYNKLNDLVEYAHSFVIDAAKLPAYPTGYFDNKDKILEYINQLEVELKIITDKGYSSYFLVVSDLAEYCKTSGITASARGSGAGSLIGYLNNISTADTVYYKIPFERFLNPLRPSAPDIDLDVADDKREQVIEYLTKKYGVNRVCQVATYGTMLPRAAVRDIGRVLGISYRKCDQLSKLIPSPPFGKKPSFKHAFETSQELNQLYQNDDEIKQIVDIAKTLEGNYRHSSVHAAAVLVTPTELTDYVSLQWDSDRKMMVCQYEGYYCEKIGIVPCKMDILGITNLSILSNSIQLVKQRKGIDIDLFNIDFNDTKVYNLLTQGRTMGVFQLAGGGMTKYLTQLKPSRVEDLIAMVALYRPGAMNSIPEFIRRKNNPELVTYYVPVMEDWMKDTYGVLVYQEDIMYTFMKLAGYSFGQADNVRRAMGKKKKEVLDKELENFEKGCLERGLDKAKVQEIWDLIVPFTDYGFNKAHAAAYGIVAYWTAYMKTNYPVEFMSALMTSEEANLVRIKEAIDDCKAMGIDVLPPEINSSVNSFNIIDNNTIRYGFGGVKNLGSDIITAITLVRKEGKFTDLSDFLSRVAPRCSINKRSVEALILSGAFDLLAV